jgi:hypothetical protein
MLQPVTEWWTSCCRTFQYRWRKLLRQIGCGASIASVCTRGHHDHHPPPAPIHTEHFGKGFDSDDEVSSHWADLDGDLEVDVVGGVVGVLQVGQRDRVVLHARARRANEGPAPGTIMQPL